MFITTVIGCFAAALVLTVRGAYQRSWAALAAAAALAMPFVVITVLSIGPFVFLFPGLDLAAAVALRMGFGWRGWLLSLLAAVLVWSVSVPLPLHAADTRFWHAVAFTAPLIGLTVAATLLIIGRPENHSLTPSS